MGTNSYEHNYSQQLKLQHKNDDLKRLQYIFRHQDDLFVVNDGGLFVVNDGGLFFTRAFIPEK